MAKYNYDKSVLKGLGVGPFLGEVKLREQHIADAPAREIRTEYAVNTVAGKLHPHIQFAKVDDIIEYHGARLYKLVPNEELGQKELAYFRAGQYVSIVIPLEADQTGIHSMTTKPFTLCSNPKAALGEKDNYYYVCVKETSKGLASGFIYNNWKKGTRVGLSGPLGHFYYQELRDAENVVAAAGGSGITPFMAMAEAIADGIEDFNLTILYGCKTEEDFLMKDRLDAAVARANGKLKVEYIVGDFITADLIKKTGEAMGDDYSLYVCGPKAMYKFLHGEVEKLGLPIRRARFEVAGEYGDPSVNPEFKGDVNAEYKVTVLAKGETETLTCKGNQTLMDAIQKAGIALASDCRSGSCGWCHSRLISGDVFIPEEADGRRAADKKFGWIHPCVTFPLSDVEIEVFPVI